MARSHRYFKAILIKDFDFELKEIRRHGKVLTIGLMFKKEVMIITQVRYDVGFYHSESSRGGEQYRILGIV